MLPAVALIAGLAAFAIWRLRLRHTDHDRPDRVWGAWFILWAVIATTALIASAATAQTPAERLTPPKEYRQREVIAVIRMADIAEVMRVCRERSTEPRPLSCQFAGGILIPFRGQVSDEMLATLIEHELGHRLGWTHP